MVFPLISRKKVSTENNIIYSLETFEFRFENRIIRFNL